MASAPSFPALRERYHRLLADRFADRAQRPGWSGAQLAAHQRTALRRLLSHAREHSPFYARRLAAIDPDRFEVEDLARIPVLTKPDMMRELDDVFTDRRLNRALVEEALTTAGPEPAAMHGRYLAQVSGGSMFGRGLFVLDLDTAVDSALCVLRANASVGTRIAMVAAGSCVHGTGLVSAMNPPGAGPTTIVSVPATLPLEEIAERVEHLDPHVLGGYPTVLARLARLRSAGRLRVAPQRVQSTGEQLTPVLRRIIREGFGAPIVDVFGCSESFMGVTEPDGAVFTFNSDMVIAELVDDQDRPVRPGVRSSAVLLTSLNNLTQPLIRYRLPDRLRQVPTGRSPLLQATAEGRDVDLFRYGDATVHPFTVSAVLLELAGVVDHQILQTPEGVEVLLVADPDIDLTGLRHVLVTALGSAGLRDADVTLTPVAGLARYRHSAKLSRYVPLDESSPEQGIGDTDGVV
ncbi:AMP-binding protein [Actinomadura sp. HBU206391]|uniref:AMP-binding protein n=1 Tax=Actinomadura sp. HBU206391 TaxID=2731692 RepID=UPI0016505724|nr:AMP-binding protein [Actinomadura sp. HBU206391]MBC6458375.1 phenylacetate--CoA ligase family protein [Actinomadura sp. HBU206391]